MYARIDKPLSEVTSEAPTTAGIPGLCSLDPSPAPHLSRLQREWLSLFCTTGAFSRPLDDHNVLLWNLGPHGLEASRIQVEALFAENRSIICLQDLRIPKRKCQDVKRELERGARPRAPQVHGPDASQGLWVMTQTPNWGFWGKTTDPLSTA